EAIASEKLSIAPPESNAAPLHDAEAEQASDEPAPSTPAPSTLAAAEPDDTGPATPAPTEPAATSWRERLRHSGFAKSFASLFSRQPALDEDFLEELETCLLTADVGIAATTLIIDDLRQRMARNEFSDARGLLDALRGELIALLVPVAEPLNIYTGAKPFVILTVGVNGVGK